MRDGRSTIDTTLCKAALFWIQQHIDIIINPKMSQWLECLNQISPPSSIEIRHFWPCRHWKAYEGVPFGNVPFGKRLVMGLWCVLASCRPSLGPKSCRVLWNSETEAQENLRSSVCIGLHRFTSCTSNSMLFCLTPFHTRIVDKDWHTFMFFGFF